MVYLILTLFFWAATAVALYWFFYTPVSAWIDGFNERHAAIIGPFFVDETPAVATQKMKRVLYGIEIALFVIGFAVSNHPLFGFWAVGLGLFAIRYFARYLRIRAAERFDDQLVDVAFAFRNSLKAGLTLPQAVQVVANDFTPPASDQFRIVGRELQIGASIEEALGHLVERVPNPDLKIMVDSVEVLRQTGGNMIETFDGVAETLKNRKKVEAKIKTLTAQGRYQTMMLCAMPFVMLLILYFMNREYVQPLFSTFLGWLLLSLMVVLVVTGYVIINKITAIEV